MNEYQSELRFTAKAIMWFFLFVILVAGERDLLDAIIDLIDAYTNKINQSICK